MSQNTLRARPGLQNLEWCKTTTSEERRLAPITRRVARHKERSTDETEDDSYSAWAPADLGSGDTAAVTIGGLIMLALGIWAFLTPASFVDFVAFPYNRLLLHDVGAFQISIGATMVLALMWADGVMVVLAGYVAGTGFHLASHIIDRHIGGHAYDPLVLGVMVAVGLAGMYARVRVSGRTLWGRAVRSPVLRERCL
jgi:hypothetical protein